LKRLNTDYIDLYLIHWPMEDKCAAEVTLDAMMELKAEGRVRMVGLSNFYAPLLKRIIPNYEIDTVQLPYNLLWRFIENGTQQLCVENGIAIMTYSSLQQGLLTGKYQKTDRFAPGDMRAKNILFTGKRFEKCLDAIEGMKTIAAKYNCTMAQLALNWVISQPGVACSLVGAMNPLEVEWNLNAASFTVSEADMAKLQKLSDSAVGDLSPTDVMWN
jgi:myo-inositol catabolism protein IolS